MSKGKHQHRIAKFRTPFSNAEGGGFNGRSSLVDETQVFGISHIKLERQKARLLRQSSWWKQKMQRPFCYYCRQEVSKTDITMDHLVPLGAGGKSEKNNLVLCCKPCNTAKKDKLAWDFKV